MSKLTSEDSLMARRIAALETALVRQCDNMAFVINHMDLPDAWYDKFKGELEIDRSLINPSTEPMT